MNKETFCAFPFESIFVNTNGEVAPCCALSGSLGNIQEDRTIEEMMQSGVASSIRKSIIEGKWHKSCEYCRVSEENGQLTQRTDKVHRLEQYRNIADENYFKLKDADIRWSNTCNLACNYCGPHFSSTWAKIKEEYGFLNRKSQEDKVIVFLEKHKDTIVTFNLLGGEPTLLKPNSILAKMFPFKTFTILSNFTFDLNTNKTAIDLLGLKHTVWGVSFENIGKRFEYVRHGASWEKFESNLEDVFIATGKPINVYPTYNVYSALYLEEFYDYIYSRNYFNDIRWTGLVYPPALDITNQTKEIKELALKQVGKVLYKYPNMLKKDKEVLLNFREGIKKSFGKTVGLPVRDKHHRLIEKIYHKKEHTLEELFPDIFNSIKVV